MYRILHLSDCHFGGSHYYPHNLNDPDSLTLGQAINRALSQVLRGARLDALILSGDFLSKDQAVDFHDATEGLARLLRDLGIKKKKHVYPVPGNHDLTWSPHYATREWFFYDKFVRGCGLKNYTRDKYPIICEMRSSTANDPPLALLLLDSCRIESEEMSGIGRIGAKQLVELEQRLVKRGISDHTHLLIASLHHHLLPISPENKIWNPDAPKSAPVTRASHTVDAVEVLRRLSVLGVSLILHGHQHRPALLSYQDLRGGSKRIHVAAAGSCGVTRTDGDEHPRHFFLYELEGVAARVHSFTESRANSTFFDEDRPVLVCFRPQDTYPSHLSSGDGAQLLSVPETRETLRAKDSNLHFIFMSVVDCPEARSVISEFAAQMQGTKPDVEREFQLLGMYDLIGYWDLAVRCRMSSGSSIDHIVGLLHTELVNKGMVADVNEGRSPFGLFKHIAVTRELQALREGSGFSDT